MDSKRHAHAGGVQRGCRLRDQLRDLVGKRAAVGIAKDDPRGAGPGRRNNCLGRVIAVELPAVEEVLGVIENLAARLREEADRVEDHGEVFLA